MHEARSQVSSPSWQANLGKTVSAETRAKISANSKSGTPEIREKLRLAHLGIPLSREHAQSIGDAHRGMKRSAEACATMSKAQQKLKRLGLSKAGKTWKLVDGKRV